MGQPFLDFGAQAHQQAGTLKMYYNQMDSNSDEAEKQAARDDLGSQMAASINIPDGDRKPAASTTPTSVTQRHETPDGCIDLAVLKVSFDMCW